MFFAIINNGRGSHLDSNLSKIETALCKKFCDTLLIRIHSRGWSGGAMVLGKLPVSGRPTILIRVGQGQTAFAVGAGGGYLDIFTLVCPSTPLLPSRWETAIYTLKYCLKGPLNPKTTNQPTNSFRGSWRWSDGAIVLGNFPVPGRPTTSEENRARACCACSRYGWVLFRHFLLSSIISFLFLPLSGRQPDID